MKPEDQVAIRRRASPRPPPATRSGKPRRQMKKTTANWLAGADYDVKAAEAMLGSKRYLYVVFMCHLAIEKTLKAGWAETRAEHPPRTHDLLLLIRELRLGVPKAHRRLVGTIANASIPTRYPEDLKKMIGQYPRRTVSSYLVRTKRVVQWLRKQLPSTKT